MSARRHHKPVITFDRQVVIANVKRLDDDAERAFGTWEALAALAQQLDENKDGGHVSPEGFHRLRLLIDDALRTCSSLAAQAIFVKKAATRPTTREANRLRHRAAKRASVHS